MTLEFEQGKPSEPHPKDAPMVQTPYTPKRIITEPEQCEICEEKPTWIYIGADQDIPFCDEHGAEMAVENWRVIQKQRGKKE